MLTGVFASLLVNPAGAQGSLAQVGRQAAAVGVTLVFSFVATTVILRLVDRVVGLRVDEAAEEEGLDRSQHGETAYVFGEGVRATRTLPFDPDAELANLREQLVMETTRRAVQALRARILSTELSEDHEGHVASVTSVTGRTRCDVREHSHRDRGGGS